MLNLTKRVILVLAVILSAQGCAVMKMVEHGSLALNPPTLDYRYYEIRDVGLEKVGVDLVFAAQNPNDFDMDKFYVDYKFYVQEKLVAEGYALEVALIPSGLSKLTVPVNLHYDRLFYAVGTLADLVIKGEKEVPTNVHVSIYGAYDTTDWLGREASKMYNYEHTVAMALPLPEVTMETVESTAKEAVNAFLGFSLFDKKKQQAEMAKAQDDEPKQAPIIVTAEGKVIDYAAFESEYPMDFGL